MSLKRPLDVTHAVSHKRLRSAAEAPPTPPSTHASSGANTPRSTTDTRPSIYKCSFLPCDASFTRPCRLAEHERSHTGVRPFECAHCGKTFSRDYHLSRHISITHADTRDHTCSHDGCNKTFATAQRKREHEKTHLRVKDHVCTGYGNCSEIFRKKNTLAAHIAKVHLGVKPFPCDAVELETGQRCTAAYDTNQKLAEHVRKWHSGARFFCTLCAAETDEPKDTEEDAYEASVASSLLEALSPADTAMYSPSASVASDYPQSASTLGAGSRLIGFQTLQQLQQHQKAHHTLPIPFAKPKGRPAIRKAGPQIRIAKPRARNNQHTVAVSSMNLPAIEESMEGQNTCLKAHCVRQFTSDSELEAHCQLEHGMALVEIADAIFEKEMLRTGKFWLGGIESTSEWHTSAHNNSRVESIDVEMDDGHGERVNVYDWNGGF